MTDPQQPGQHHVPAVDTIKQLVKDARRAGIDKFQVLALVHRRGDREHVLLLNRAEQLWSLPTAWVRRAETVLDTLDWLCSVHLGLLGWDATAYPTTVVLQLPGDGEALQIAFDITVPTSSEPGWPGTYQWWHTHTEPPPLHHLARPALEQLHGIPPRANPVRASITRRRDPAALRFTRPDSPPGSQRESR